MKIAHIVCTFPPYKGGIGKSALDFSRMMASDGHQVSVYTPMYRKETPENEPPGLVVKRIKPLLKIGNGAFIPSLFFRLKKYDLIYLHYPFFGGSEVLWLFGIFNKRTKIIIHYHMDVVGLSPLLSLLSLPTKLIEASLLKRADLITVGSLDYIKNSHIKKYFARNKNKFRETFFPVDTAKFHPLANRVEKNQKIILFVGGLDKAHYFKGLNVLIEAMVILRDRSDWKLLIVGRGGLLGDYKIKCRENNIQNRVEFLDSVSDEELPRVYRNSDFFVLPSINKGEAFGIVLLEAMSSGLPVIASDLPGVRSVFTDKEGLKVTPGDKTDLANKITLFLENKDFLLEMSVSARALSEKRYSYEKISERIRKIVEETKK